MSRARSLLVIGCLLLTAVIGAQPRGPVAVPVTDALPPRPPAATPSPRNASYQIEARLDHDTRTVTGRQTVRWRNITSQPTRELQFHLYWNGWRNADSTWMRERRLATTTRVRGDAWGAIDVSAIRLADADGGAIDLTAAARFIAPDDGNAADRTVMAVTLPASVGPDQDVTIEMAWTARVPRPFARTGYIDDYYFIGHWFPKLGVLEDGGWNTHQFHSATEFFSDFGSYDVSLTVPAGFVVGASGREAARSGNADGTVTHRYRADDVHDFAWTASPRFRESRQAFEHPTLPRVEMRLLLQPEHAGQEARHFAATAATLKYYGEWFGAYPYDTITVVDPAYQSSSGGMEYPTLITAGTRWLAPADVTVPEAVTIHEAGHQFWYGLVATNEFEHAWLDEGINTYSTARVIEQIQQPNHLALRYFGGFVPWFFRDIRLSRATDGNRLPGYRPAAESDAPSTPTFRYWPGTGGLISYNKTALWLHTLERHLGWPVMQRMLATYFERWKFRHPGPADFFAVASEAAGQDLTWFFDQVYRSSNVFDYGVQTLVSEPAGEGRFRTTTVARRLGEATFPVDVVTTFEDGEQVTERWDGRDRRAPYVYERPSRALRAEVDPQRVLLLDVDWTNNSRTLEPRAAEAATRWSLKWMVWMQDLLLTYGVVG